jgi:hypothetical protein
MHRDVGMHILLAHGAVTFVWFGIGRASESHRAIYRHI